MNKGHWAICSLCNGSGQHSRRFGAMSMDRFQEVFDDEDSQEAYFRGDYDEACQGQPGLPCQGGKVWISEEPADIEARDAAHEAAAERD